VRPFLTILTRCHYRTNELENNIKALNLQSDPDFQQIFFVDTKGSCYGRCGDVFDMFGRELIKGIFVYVLDDDNFVIDNELIQDLKQRLVKEIFNIAIIKSIIENRAFPLGFHLRELLLHDSTNLMAARPIALRNLQWFGKGKHKITCPSDQAYNDRVIKTSGATIYWRDKISVLSTKLGFKAGSASLQEMIKFMNKNATFVNSYNLPEEFE
jgi:hypothetical protein